MDWKDLLFMHWPIEAGHLRPFIPPALEIETFEGNAWLGVVPFTMSGTRARFTPPVPGLSRFPELNVRTYVRPAGGPEQNRPGVWFFSLDVTRRAAVEAARTIYHLPYFRATMSAGSMAGSGGRMVTYSHQRIDSNTRVVFGSPCKVQACFAGRYRPVGPVRQAAPESLESFLTDRYRLYAWAGRRSGEGQLYSAEIHHPPWPLQDAEAEITSNTMTGFLGIEDLPGEPLLHFSRFIKVAAWLPQRVPGTDAPDAQTG